MKMRQKVRGVEKGMDVITSAFSSEYMRVHIMPSGTYLDLNTMVNHFAATVRLIRDRIAIYEPIKIEPIDPVSEFVAMPNYKTLVIPPMIYQVEFSELLEDEIWDIIAKDMLDKWHTHIKTVKEKAGVSE